MSTHNIYLCKKVERKYTCRDLKTTELLDCALIGVCAVIRLNMVGPVYRIYLKYSDTSTPNHICSKIWTSTIYYLMLCLNIAGWMANSVDPDEMPHSAVSHLGLHCLLRPDCLNTYSIMPGYLEMQTLSFIFANFDQTAHNNCFSVIPWFANFMPQNILCTPQLTLFGSMRWMMSVQPWRVTILTIRFIQGEGIGLRVFVV